MPGIPPGLGRVWVGGPGPGSHRVWGAGVWGLGYVGCRGRARDPGLGYVTWPHAGRLAG